VGFLSYTVVLKGLQYLLEAWENIMAEPGRENMQLIIGGPVNPVMKSYISKHYAEVKNVTYTGQVNDIPAFMQDLDLFVVPSLIDGGPLTALEAAHYAVPVLITDNSGSCVLVSKGDGGGYVIPIRDAEAIKEKILWAYNHKEQKAQFGLNAKQNLDNYSFEEYIVRLSDYLQTELND